MLLLSLIVVVALVGLLAGCRATRAGYESAPYQVIRAAGKFEVRDYPVLTVVETPMAATGSGADGGFMRLFRFISGANEAKQKIAMTTPVFMSGSGNDLTMAFVLPAKLKAGDAPQPAEGSVKRRVPSTPDGSRCCVSGRAQRGERGSRRLAPLAKPGWWQGQGLPALSPPV